jgi:type II secretory pathway pseudopilin PulG
MIPLLRSRRRAFSLLEVIFSMLILLLAGLSIVASIIYSRQSMELNKQQIAAYNYCRQYLEQAVSMINEPLATNLTLVPFNTPGLEIDALLTANYYLIQTDGSIDWATPRAQPVLLPTDPVAAQPLFYCRVTATWVPPGRMSRPQQIQLSSILRKGIL